MKRAIAALVAATLLPVAAAHAACDDWIATMVSIEGTVQGRRAGIADWVATAIGERYCLGDSIRAQARSRAALMLRDDAVLRLDQSTTITFVTDRAAPTSWVELLRGAAHFFSRRPRGLKVLTPFVNGTVEGTEFWVEVASDRTSLTVFEGRVSAENPQGTLNLDSGQAAVARAGQPPQRVVVVRPRDAVQWALHYPSVVDPRPEAFADIPGEDWPRLVRRSIEAYRKGDLAGAFAALEPVRPDVADPRLFVYRASLLLAVGRVDEADADLARALRLDPGHPGARALRAVVAVVQNDAAAAFAALPEARQPLAAGELPPRADADASVARVALSFAQQATFDLQGALQSLEDAIKLDPQNALAWARLAELLLSFGRVGEALSAARQAVRLNPDLARAHTVLGFTHLADLDTRAAVRAFERAIARDQADPLPRLGLGLARIRRGDVEGGRREIEIAAGLDPGNALIRSYLGKAYDEEHREALVDPQFATAKSLDPKDPTPWLYDALHQQHGNRPVEALQSLNRAIELNDNRAIYRSRLLLDEDLAARSASLARIYDELGFQQLALAESWRSLAYDPTNYSAHRFLGETYSALPRHEIARVSELLQSQLLQPLANIPVPPDLGLARPFILSGAGPATASFNEFTSLFTRDRLSLLLGGVAGNQRTFGDEAVLSGVLGRVAFSLGQFHYESGGFRPNNDVTHNIYNAFAQLSLTRDTSVQAEYRSTDVKMGDLQLSFDPDLFFRNLREHDYTESIRVGGRHVLAPHSTLLGSFIYQWANFDTTFGDPFRFRVEQNGFTGEMLYLYRSARVNLAAGAGHTVADRADILPSFDSRTDAHITHTNGYLYTYLNLVRSLTVTAGLSGDRFRGGIVDADGINPKFGVTWSPIPPTTLRLAAFRTFNRTLTSNQTLEPTQVAGFNQFFADGEGTRAWRYGVGLDHKFAETVFGGVEQSWRRLDVPGQIIGPGADVVTADWKEQLSRAYLYWTPLYWLALSLEYQYERFTRNPDFLNLGEKTDIQTHRIPIGLNIFLPWGFISRWKATYLDQHGDFATTAGTVARGSDRFWVVDASVGYRLPRRLGLVSFEVRNLLDERFRFQDTDPTTPRIQPERLLLGRIILAY